MSSLFIETTAEQLDVASPAEEFNKLEFIRFQMWFMRSNYDQKKEKPK